MSNPALLEAVTVSRVLAKLGVAVDIPDLPSLHALVDAYARHVPWESASRIVRRARTTATADCPRWPVQFWEQHLDAGTGGTCFESNYAFFTLLRALGYTGTLTLNNMRDSVGCHTASIIELDGDRFLVDVGIPLYAPVPLKAGEITQWENKFHTYTIEPQGDDHYLVMRDRHSRADIFTLVDLPVDEDTYRAATTADYGTDGLFLDRIIVSKIVDGRQWRFSSESPPYQFESFHQGDATYHYIGDTIDAVASAVAAKFGIDRAIIAQAMTQTVSVAGD